MVKYFLIVFFAWFTVAFFPAFVKSWIINAKIKKAARKAGKFEKWMYK